MWGTVGVAASPGLSASPVFVLSSGSTAVAKTLIDLLSCSCMPCTVPIVFHQRYYSRRTEVILQVGKLRLRKLK